MGKSIIIREQLYFENFMRHAEKSLNFLHFYEI